MFKTILAIDTSDRSADVGVLSTGQIARASSRDTKSVEQLPSLIEKCLKECSCNFSDLQLVLVSIGPGSFTGIRAGVAFGEGICAAYNIPIIGISSILSRAHLGIETDGDHLVSLTASKSEFFSSIIHKTGKSTQPRSEVQCELGAEIDENISLDTISGAQGLLEYFRDSLEFRVEVETSDFYGHILKKEAGIGLMPLYVKQVSAKTLVERGLRESS